MEKLKIETALQIAKSAEEIYQAIILPEHMCHYFISKSSGSMEQGKQISWEFPEFKESFQIKVLQLIPNEFISFEWPGMETQILQVNIELKALEGGSTVVNIYEGEVVNNDQGLAWLSRNSAGWANFLACLKAYLEFGINLRKGGFDFMGNI